MEEKKLAEIEEEISRELEGKVKNVDSKDSKEIIEAEVKNKNYLSEDWQVDYAVQRIQEKIEEIRRQQREQRLKMGIGADEQVLIKGNMGSVEAKIVQKFLEANGIKSVIQFGPSIYGRSEPGGAGIFVLEKDAEKAKDLLNQMENK